MAKPLPWTRLLVVTVETVVAKVMDGNLTAGMAFVWFALLAMTNTGAATDRGLIVDARGEPLSIRALARRTGVSRGTARAAIKAFRKLGWIERERSGCWRIVGFDAWTMTEGVAGAGQNLPGDGRNWPALAKNCQGGDQKLPWQGLTNTPEMPNGSSSKGQQDQEQIEPRLPAAAATNGGQAERIDVEETKDRDNRAVVADSDPSSTRQRPETEATSTLLGALAVAFSQAVGRPMNAKDEAAVAELVSEGHAVAEIAQAVAYYGRTRNMEMRRGGIRYCAPMLRKGMFRAGAIQSRAAASLPNGNISIGHDADLIRKRRAQRLALPKESKQGEKSK